MWRHTKKGPCDRKIDFLFFAVSLEENDTHSTMSGKKVLVANSTLTGFMELESNAVKVYLNTWYILPIFQFKSIEKGTL